MVFDFVLELASFSKQGKPPSDGEETGAVDSTRSGAVRCKVLLPYVIVVLLKQLDMASGKQKHNNLLRPNASRHCHGHNIYFISGSDCPVAAPEI